MDVITQIDLDLAHKDWNRVRGMYQGLRHRLEQGLLTAGEMTSYGSQSYWVGREGLSGSLLVDQQHTDRPWVAWCGRLLEDLVPELSSIATRMRGDGLDAGTVTYNRIHGAIGRHRDGKEPGQAPRGQCNINYIIGCSDARARTFAERPDGTVQSYPSRANTAWCLDTAVPHWVECGGEREFIQLCVHEPLARVVEWFGDYNTR